MTSLSTQGLTPSKPLKDKLTVATGYTSGPIPHSGITFNSDDEDDSHSDEGREDNLSDSGSTVEPDTSASVTISAPTELRRSK